MPQRLTRSTRLILEFLLERHLEPDGLTWGFEIANDTGLKGGTVYPVLSRLLDEGWLEAFWDNGTSSGPRRRMYRLTSSGATAAARLLNERGRSQAQGVPSCAPTF